MSDSEGALVAAEAVRIKAFLKNFVATPNAERYEWLLDNHPERNWDKMMNLACLPMRAERTFGLKRKHVDSPGFRGLIAALGAEPKLLCVGQNGIQFESLDGVLRLLSQPIRGHMENEVYISTVGRFAIGYGGGFAVDSRSRGVILSAMPRSDVEKRLASL